MTQPPPVTRPAAMMRLETLAEFKRMANGFYLMFIEMPESVRHIYHFRPAYWRFVAKYPKKAAELTQVLGTEGRHPGSRSWPLLHDAYKLMAGMVDISDKGVVRRPDPADPYIDPNTGVDTWYLCR